MYTTPTFFRNRIYIFLKFRGMGRRAKNKQGPPEPYQPRTPESPKKLGKRKATSDAPEKAPPSKRSKGHSSRKNLPSSSVDDGSSASGWESIEDDDALRSYVHQDIHSFRMNYIVTCRSDEDGKAFEGNLDAYVDEDHE